MKIQPFHSEADKRNTCPSEEVALKSFFLGPLSENGDWFRQEVAVIVDHYLNWRKERFPEDGTAISEGDRRNPDFQKRQALFHGKVIELLQWLERETPKFTPRYIGHMVSEVSLPALLGHLLTLLHNPNNASREVSKVTSEIEEQAIAKLAQMLGFESSACGHFTSGGTMANYEALWRALRQCYRNIALGIFLKENHFQVSDEREDLFYFSQLSPEKYRDVLLRFNIEESWLASCDATLANPFTVAKLVERVFGVPFEGPVVLVPGHKHYSWQKAVALMGLGNSSFTPVALDEEGRLDVTHLKTLIEHYRKISRPIAMVVSVAGTTELGEVDPLHEIQAVLDEYRNRDRFLWHHVDAAYGGFYASLLTREKEAKALLGERLYQSLYAMRFADSITIDPHKLGYVPYSCGAFLARTALRYRSTSFSAPYLVGGAKPSPWANTLEGSRPGSGPVAMWLTAECVGLNYEGYGKILEKGIVARQRMEMALSSMPNVYCVPSPDTNVLCFLVAKKGEPLSSVNSRTAQIYQKIYEGNEFAVSKTELGKADYQNLIKKQVTLWSGSADADSMTLIRLVLMNPFITSKEMNCDYFTLFTAYLERLLRSLSPEYSA